MPFSKIDETVPKPLGGRHLNNPITLGEKLRNRRIEKGMFQTELAELMGVSETSINYWENNKSQPSIQLYPKVIEFLGYFPFTINTDKLSGRITMFRYTNGLTQATLAKLLGVNESTIQYYEGGKSLPGRKIRGKIIALSTDKLAMFDKNDFESRGAGYVENPVTIGEKLRNRRLEKLMNREELAELIGIDQSTLQTWELNTANPHIKHYPKIIDFLGYFPWDIDTTTILGKLTYYRYVKGLTDGEFTKIHGISKGSLHRCETGVLATSRTRMKIVKILSSIGFSVDVISDFGILKAYSKNPITLGEKIRNRRLEKLLTQKDVATHFEITIDTYNNWELNKHLPPISSYPAVIEFLGYFPWEIDTSNILGKLEFYRYSMGLTKIELAKALGVSISTLVRLETGKLNPTDDTQIKLANALSKMGFNGEE